jgi:hypothetical protein
MPAARPADVDQSREVAQFGFVVEGVSLRAMTQDVQDDLKEAVCDVFLAQTLSGSECLCELKPGSVKAKVTITAPVGEVLGDVRTPTPSTVVSAVTSVPNIETAREGSKPIGVASVSGVLFKADSTTAATIAPPTPPSPPPTDAADDDDDEDEESTTCRSKVALALSVTFALTLVG